MILIQCVRIPDDHVSGCHWQLLYCGIVHTLYIHGTDVSVHVYARWSGIQMNRPRQQPESQPEPRAPVRGHRATSGPISGHDVGSKDDTISGVRRYRYIITILSDIGAYPTRISGIPISGMLPADDIRVGCYQNRLRSNRSQYRDIPIS